MPIVVRGLRGVLSAGAMALAAAVPSPAGASGAAEPPPTPVKILLAMERVYAGCTSYRDTGDVKSVVVTDGGRAATNRPFLTAFVRPDRFRFQFTDPGLGERAYSYIVWSDGSEVRSWWDAKPGERRPGSLQEALAPAAGISGGSSVRVPGLLLPETLGEGPLLIAPERLDDGVDRGVACFRIQGKGRKTPYTLTMGARVLTVQDESVTLWIDRATYLLHKVEETRTFDTYRSEATTNYLPEINVEIHPAQLKFR